MTDYELLEDYESDYEFDEELGALLGEDDEARRRRTARRRPVRTGKGAGYYQARPSGKYVSEAQLKSALAKVSNDVKANATGIKSLGARVDATTEAVKKEAIERRKDLAKLKSGMQLSALLPLLSQKSVTTTSEAGGIPSGTKVAVAPDGLGMLLPLLLTGDGLGGGGSGGDSSNMLVLALALSGSL